MYTYTRTHIHLHTDTSAYYLCISKLYYYCPQIADRNAFAISVPSMLRHTQDVLFIQIVVIKDK